MKNNFHDGEKHCSMRITWKDLLMLIVAIETRREKRERRNWIFLRLFEGLGSVLFWQQFNELSKFWCFVVILTLRHKDLFSYGFYFQSSFLGTVWKWCLWIFKFNRLKSLSNYLTSKINKLTNFRAIFFNFKVSSPWLFISSHWTFKQYSLKLPLNTKYYFLKTVKVKRNFSWYSS